MSLCLRANALVAVLTVLVVTISVRADPPADRPDSAPEQESPKKPRVLVTISEETTRITSPLREDGYVDYVAALNELTSRDVTPENNSAVLFWQAMGPSKIDEQQRERYFAMLGMQPLPEKGDYFVSLEDYIRSTETSEGDEPSYERFDEIRDQLDEAMHRPWSKKEFPVLADWLDANEKPLKLLVEASRRPRRYDPMIAPGEGVGSTVMACLLPSLQLHREVARALTARAMLEAAEGRVDNAWSDLLVCHRLARLTGQGGSLVDAMVAIAINEIACRGDEGLLQHVRLTTDQAKAMREDLRKLDPMPKMIDRIDVGDRYMYLDSVGLFAREGVGELNSLDGPGSKTDGVVKTIIKWASRAVIDWDIALRMGNSWFDRMVDACGKSTRAEQQDALTKIDDELRRLAEKTRNLKSFPIAVLGNPREAISRQIGAILVTLILPAVDAATTAEDRGTMRAEVTHLGFALAAFRADHGSYPARLADLVPKYAAEVPHDIFTAEQLHYKQRRNGYVLYSVGINGEDEGGLSYDDRDERDDYDDIAIRVPSKKPRKPTDAGKR